MVNGESARADLQSVRCFWHLRCELQVLVVQTLKGAKSIE